MRSLTRGNATPVRLVGSGVKDLAKGRAADDRADDGLYVEGECGGPWGLGYGAARWGCHGAPFSGQGGGVRAGIGAGSLPGGRASAGLDGRAATWAKAIYGSS